MPRRTRCVFGCRDFKVLHRFPKPNDFTIDRFLQWKKLSGKALEEYTDHSIYTNCRICNNHFEEYLFYPNSKRLARTAYPTLKLEIIHGTVLHLFPNPEKDLERFNLWLKAVGGPILTTDPVTVFTRRRVCHLHFERKFHTWSKRLTANSIPTLLLNGKQSTSAGASTTAVNDNELDDIQDGLVDDIDPIPADSAAEDNVVTEEIIINDDDDVIIAEQTYEVPVSKSNLTDESVSLHVGYKCNICDTDIKGYVCIECVDWDMCSGCEARAAHSHHYVLRLPGPRPQNEIQPILERIRRELMELNVFIEDRIKQEKDLDQSDPLQEEVTSIESINALPDIQDEQMNTPLIFDDIHQFTSGEEEVDTEKPKATVISNILIPSTSNITKIKPSLQKNIILSDKNIINMETSETITNNTIKSVRPSVKYIIKGKPSVKPTVHVGNIQKNKFIIKKLIPTDKLPSNLKVINTKLLPQVKLERSDLKQMLIHIKNDTTKKS